MYAIFKTGGKQYNVKEGDEIYIEKLDVEVGKKVNFNEVLLVGDKVGSPFVEGAEVIAEVVKNAKAKKIIIFKFKAKKDYRRKQGHRQPYTKVKITSIKKA